MSSSNPYNSPMNSGSPSPGLPAPGNGFVKQVPVVGILMAIAGGMELLMGLFLIGSAFLVPHIMSQPPGRQVDPANLETAQQVLFWVYLGMGAGGALGGLLRLIGGIQVARFRSHSLGIVSNFVGLLAMSTCYCIPISLGISVYALIVLFQAPVRAEFAYRSR